MSCFIMSPQSIADLSSCIVQVTDFGTYFINPKTHRKFEEVFSEFSYAEIAEQLYSLNEDAYLARYGEETEEFETFFSRTSIKIPEISKFQLKNWIYIFKKLQCFLYQCNEFQESSPIQDVLTDFLSELAFFIVQKTNEYHQILWS